jgi:tetratricopeptide (TPR) repeat protein
MFRCLSVFRGGFTLEAVQGLWSDGGKSDQEALELLTHLVDKSLVAITSRAEARRFGLLETIHQYALERLESAGETDTTLAKHREWFTSWAKAQGRLLATANQLAALEALEADHDNLRAILERSMTLGDVEPALRMAADISFFWWLHSHFGEAGAWFKRLLAVGEKVPPRVHAKVLHGAGRFSWMMSDQQLAKERLSEARLIAQEIDAPRIEGWALQDLMVNEFQRLDLDAARIYGEQALRAFQKAGDLLGIGFITYLQTVGEYFDLRRKNEVTPEVAEKLMSKLEPMLAAAQQIGDRNLLGLLLELLGRFALDAGRIDEAGVHFSEAVRAFQTLGNQALLARALDQVAILAARADHPAAAIRLLGATTTLRRHIGIPARPVEQLVVDEALETARKNLTEESFKDAWAEGIRMTRDQAVQHARAITDGTASRL